MNKRPVTGTLLQKGNDFLMVYDAEWLGDQQVKDQNKKVELKEKHLAAESLSLGQHFKVNPQIIQRMFYSMGDAGLFLFCAIYSPFLLAAGSFLGWIFGAIGIWSLFRFTYYFFRPVIYNPKTAIV